MPEKAEEKQTNTEDFGCFTNPFTPEPAKKGTTAPAPAADPE